MEAMLLSATEHFQILLLPKTGHIKKIVAEFPFPVASPELPTPSEILDKKAGVGAILDLGVYAFAKVDLAFAGSATHVVHASSIPYNTSKKDIDEVNTVVFTPSRASTAIVTTSMTVPDRQNFPLRGAS